MALAKKTNLSFRQMRISLPGLQCAQIRSPASIAHNLPRFSFREDQITDNSGAGWLATATTGNCLKLFDRRVVAVQVNRLSYFATTEAPQMDVVLEGEKCHRY